MMEMRRPEGRIMSLDEAGVCGRLFVINYMYQELTNNLHGLEPREH